jgi:hypothetical protein
LFSSLLLLGLSLTAIPIVILQSEAQQPLLNEKEMILDDIHFFVLDALEYTFEINAPEIFPNDTVKHSILTDYEPSVYNIPSLQYKIMEHMIIASDVQIHVNPTRINEAHTRLDFQIYAKSAEVTGQWLSKSYNNLEIRSAYGIYDQVTDKMTIHVPYSVAVEQILQ